MMNDNGSIGAMYGGEDNNGDEPGQRRRPWSMQQGLTPPGTPGQLPQRPQWSQGGGQDGRAMAGMFQGQQFQRPPGQGGFPGGDFRPGGGDMVRPGQMPTQQPQAQPMPPGVTQWPPQQPQTAPQRRPPFQGGFPPSQAPTT